MTATTSAKPTAGRPGTTCQSLLAQYPADHELARACESGQRANAALRRSLRAHAQSEGPTLLAAADTAVAAVDRKRRTITGRLITYGEVGRTNLGPLAIRAGAITLGAKVIGIYGHDREQAVGRLVAATDGPDGLDGTFLIAPTPLGDQLLAEADPEVGVREGLSIELDAMTFDPFAGDVVAAAPLEFVAFVPIGAYASSVATSVVAQAQQEGPSTVRVRRNLARFARDPQEGGGGGALPPVATAAPAAPQAPAQPPVVPTSAPTAPTEAPAPAAGTALPQIDAAALQAAVAAHFSGQLQAAAAVVPGGLPVAGRQAQGGQGQPSALLQIARLTAQLHNPDNAGAAPQLRAALNDITNANLNLFQDPANTAATELWTGGGYTRRFVPLMSPKTLTSWKFQGWRWLVRPQVAPYAGNKAAVPSNQPSMELEEGSAERIAGAHDIDRKFRDFGDAAFWTGYYDAMTESYAEQSDLIAAAALIAMARDIATDGGLIPASYSDAADAGAADVLRAAALGSAILEDTPNVRKPAAFVLMNTSDWLQLLNFTNLDLPAFLALLGVKPENFQRTEEVPAGHVICGVREASSFYELGGGAPIRVEAIDVGRAGIDAGVYGYVGTLENRPGGIISVPLVVPAAG